MTQIFIARFNNNIGEISVHKLEDVLLKMEHVFLII